MLSKLAVLTAGVSGQSILQELKNLALGGQQAPPLGDPTQALKEESTQPAKVADAAGGDIPDYMTYMQGIEQMDLLCLNSTTSQQWFTTQQKMRYIMGVEAAFRPLVKEHTLEPALGSILEDMGPIAVQDYCGVGKLLIQLLSLLNMDTDGSLIEQQMANEQLTSPLLTLLLDVPWMAYQPHWPMFGFLAQLSLRRSAKNPNSDIVDGLVHPDLQKYAATMQAAIVTGDIAALTDLSKAYLDADMDAVTQSPIGFLTAVFTRVVTTENPEDARGLFFEAQKVFKKIVTTPSELDMTLATKWPLWGMAYLASLKV